MSDDIVMLIAGFIHGFLFATVFWWYRHAKLEEKLRIFIHENFTEEEQAEIKRRDG